MRSSMRLVTSALSLVLLAACAGQLGVSNAPTAPTAPLGGELKFPVALIGQGHVIPTGIGAVIPAGAGNVIPAGAGNVIAAGSGNYRVLDAAAEPELPVSGATIVALDPASRARIPGVGSTRTDATGHFQLAGTPAGSLVLVEAAFLSPDGQHGFRLLSLGRGGQSADAAVSAATTIVVEGLLQLASSHPGAVDWPRYDASTLPAQAAALQQALAALPAAKRDAELTTLLGVEPGAIASATVQPLLGPSPALPSPDAAGGALGAALGSTLGAVLGASATSTAQPSPGASQPSSAVGSALPVASALPSLLPSLLPSIQPSGLGGLASSPTPSPLSSLLTQTTGALLPTATPSAAPTSTPAPTPTPTPLVTLPTASPLL